MKKQGGLRLVTQVGEKMEITEAMIEEIDIHREWFYEQTSGGHIINYLNGFTAAGVCTEPQDNLTKKVNPIWVYGINHNGSNVEELINVEMPEDEVLDLLNCLKITLKKNKKNILKRLLSITTNQ